MNQNFTPKFAERQNLIFCSCLIRISGQSKLLWVESMFSVVACWSGLRWSLEQTTAVSTSEESAHSDTHQNFWLLSWKLMKENPWLKWIDEDSWEWFVFLIYLQENPFAWYTTPRFAIPIWLIAHNNIITILSQSCTSKLNVVQYDIFSGAQADVTYQTLLQESTTTTNVRVLGIFLASTPSCEKH
jgi:hypothetical protein